MALKEIANANCTLSIQFPDSGDYLISSTPSSKVKAVGAGIYAGGISVALSNVSNSTTGNSAGAGSGTIDPTAIKVKDQGQLVNRVDDQASIEVTGVNSSGSPITWSVTIKVSDAGQIKVKAE